MNVTHRLGDKIRKFRKEAGMSQLDLELAIGASTGMISRIENGDVNPTKETLFKIAEALKLSGEETAMLFGLDITSIQKSSKDNAQINAVNLKNVLDLTTRKWVSVLGVSYAVIFLWDEKEELLKVTSITIPQASRAVFEKVVGDKVESVILHRSNPVHARGHYMQSLQKKEILVTTNVADFAESLVPASLYNAVSSMLGMKMAITVPLITQGKSLGVLGLIWPKETYSKQHQSMIETFAEQVSINIYNAKLLDHIQESKNQLE